MHRDVKPSNLILCGADCQHVKLTDFGIARQVPCNIGDLNGDSDLEENDVRETRWEMTGTTGTYRYMAPEVWLQQVCTSFILNHSDKHRVLSRRTCKSPYTQTHTDTMRTHAPTLTRTHTHPHAPTHTRCYTQKYGCKADVYSATMVLYFLITGKLAFAKVHPELIKEVFRCILKRGGVRSNQCGSWAEGRETHESKAVKGLTCACLFTFADELCSWATPLLGRDQRPSLQGVA